MAIVDLDISELTEIYDNLRKVEKRLDRYHHEVSDVLMTLDLKVMARKNIDVSLNHIKKYLEREKVYIGTCAGYVKNVIDSFTAEDKIHHFPEYSFHVENIKPSAEGDMVFDGGAMHGTPDPLLEHFEDIHLRMTEEVEQIFMNNMNAAKVEDVATYRKYLQM